MAEGNTQLARRFEEHRPRLQGMAYRMLGSLSDADDALQEAWLRLDRADVSGVQNLGAWLTTVVTRLCLDLLRSRQARREEPIAEELPEPDIGVLGGVVDPEQEAVLADSVGRALLVVLETLKPAERLVFVLHDMFDLPFSAIGPIIGRTPNSAAQLASRARRRVRGRSPESGVDHSGQRRVIDAFLAAARHGDIEALIAVLDADVVLRVDHVAAQTPAPVTVRGAHAVASGASMFAGYANHAEPALINGAIGLIVASKGHLDRVLRFTISDDRIVELSVSADVDFLRNLEIAVLDEPPATLDPDSTKRACGA